MAEERIQRKLAAILAADVVGYSRLMGVDEEGTLTRLKGLRADIIDPKIAEYGGRVFKSTGDGVLAEFRSAVDAVRHAVNVQQAMSEVNAGLEEEDRILLRIGISLGDVMVDGDDLFGNGVNVAARMEGLADSGGICVSGNVQEHVSGVLNVTLEDLGEQVVKNINRPVRCFRVLLPSSDKRMATAPPLPDKPSIAVLPFQNMSGDTEQEYFADGVVEDIITGLSRIRWFFVIARNSSFAYKRKAIDVREVGRQLGVRYVLEGSVRKAGRRVRITAQLVEAATGNHLWAERFDGDLSDVFDLQDQITVGVVGAIEPSVRLAEIERSRQKRPENLDAYDLYLRALPYLWAHTPADTDQALDLLQAALAIDPSFGAAQGLVARCYQQRYLRAGKALNDRRSAIEHARTVLAIGSDDSTALAQAAMVIIFLDHDHETARSTLDNALALNPNSAHALGISAILNSFLGRHEIAIDHARQSVRLSPFDPVRYYPDIGLTMACFCTGRYEEAGEAARRALQSNPRFVPAHAMLAACQIRLGQLEEARSTSKRILEMEPDFHFMTSIGLVMTGQPSDAENIVEALRAAGLPE